MKRSNPVVNRTACSAASAAGDLARWASRQSFVRLRPGTVGYGAPIRPRKSHEAAVSFPATRRLDLPSDWLSTSGDKGCARPGAVTTGGRRHRARADRRSRAPAHPGLRARPTHRLVTTAPLTRTRRLASSCLRPPPACPHAATLAPAPAPKRHDKRADGAARRDRQPALDPPYRLLHTRPRVLEVTGRFVTIVSSGTGATEQVSMSVPRIAPVEG